jgi:hypothetical protein
MAEHSHDTMSGLINRLLCRTPYLAIASAFKLEDVPKMVEMMNEHKAQGQMGVVFE